MALIGTMKYLTIGDKTYEIEGEQLSIASASTLGGIKVGSGLSIDSTTGVLSTSITETDPVFSASTAAGITSTDISNWNAKSDTDEKLKTVSAGSNTTYYPVVGNMSSTAETKYYSGNFRYSKSTGIDALQLGQVSSSSTSKGRLVLCSGAYYTYLDPPAYNLISDNKTYTLPTSSGTIALTSDIPTVPSSTGSATTGVTIADHSSTTIYGVQSSTTSVTGVSGSTTASKVIIGSSSTDYGVTAAGSGSATLTFTMDTTDTKKLKVTFSHTHTAPTLGSKVPTVSASNVTVPIAAASATTVPIKNASTTTVITSKTHTVTDNGHTHTI